MVYFTKGAEEYSLYFSINILEAMVFLSNKWKKFYRVIAPLREKLLNFLYSK